MTRKKETPGQYSLEDYQLKEVGVRLKLMDGPAYYSKRPLSSPREAVDVMRDVLKELDREWVCVVNMDNHLKPVNFNVVSIGSINQSLAPIQNIFKSAILSNCSNIMLMHNHPSGDVEPSEQDQKLTARLVEASKLMDMQVLDHLIVGGGTGEVFSFRQRDPDLFERSAPDLDLIHRMTGEVQEKKADYQAGRKKYDPEQAAENRKNEMKDITDRLEKGVTEVFASGRYQQFLDMMAKFPKYSVNNSLLIMMQKPDASLVQSYTAWQRMGRQVKRGERGIRILAPSPYTIQKDQERLGPDGKPLLDRDGEPIKDRVEMSLMAFKPVSTFDISQTEGDPLPTLGVQELKGSVEHYETLFEALESASPVPVAFENISGGAKGYFDRVENRIAIQSGMDEVQNVKTLIHEMAHARLHNDEAQKARPDGAQSRESREVEAESVAYTVCQHLGIDTGEYSFGYIAGWSAGKELPELKESLQTIRETSAEIIRKVDDIYAELANEKGRRRTLEKQVAKAASCGDRMPQYSLESLTRDATYCLSGREYRKFVEHSAAAMESSACSAGGITKEAFLQHVERAETWSKTRDRESIFAKLTRAQEKTEGHRPGHQEKQREKKER